MTTRVSASQLPATPAGVFFLALASTMVIGLAAQAASSERFSCDDPKGWAERTICQYDELTEINLKVDLKYRILEERLTGAEQDRLRASQRAWVTDRDTCKTKPSPIGCLRKSLSNRVTFLEAEDASGGSGSLAGPPLELADYIAFADKIDKRLDTLKRRAMEDKGAIIQLWVDASAPSRGDPIKAREPASRQGDQKATHIDYYFRGDQLYFVRTKAFQAGFRNRRMLFWIDEARQPFSGPQSQWEARQRSLIERGDWFLLQMKEMRK